MYAQDIAYEDSLINVLQTDQKRADRAEALFDLALHYYRQLDSKAVQYAKEAAELYYDLKNYKKSASSYRLLGYCYSETASDYGNGIPAFQKALEIDGMNKDTLGQVKSLKALGGHYGNMGEYSMAVDHLYKALNLLDDGAFEENDSRMGIYFSLGGVHVNMTEYQAGIDAYTKAEYYAKLVENDRMLGMIYQNSGIIYMSIDSMNLALENFNRSYDILAESNNYYNWYLLETNLAAVYNKLGQLDTALYFANQSYAHYKESNNINGMASALLAYGAILTSKKEYQKSEEKLNEGLALVDKLELKPIRFRYYNQYSKLYEAWGKHEQSLKYYKMYSELKSSVLSLEEEKKIGDIKLKLEEEKNAKQAAIKDLKIKELEISEQQEANRKYLIGISLTAFLLVSLLIILRQRTINKKNKEIFIEREKRLKTDQEIKELELLHAEREVENLQQDLKSFTKNISEKNSLIEQLETQLKEISIHTEDGQKQKEQAMAELYSLKILTEADWQRFKELFNEVHKGALTKIRDEHPTLTQAEERLILLLKMNFTTAEISGITGVSIGSARKSRQRLRSKLNLNPEEVLEDVVRAM